MPALARPVPTGDTAQARHWALAGLRYISHPPRPPPHHPNPSSFRLLSSPLRRSHLACRSRPLLSRSSLSPVRLILTSFPCSAVSMAFFDG